MGIRGQSNVWETLRMPFSPHELGEKVYLAVVEEGDAGVRSAYGANYDRGAAVKVRYYPFELLPCQSKQSRRPMAP